MNTAPYYNLYSKFADKGLINCVHMDCTYRCNLNCRHCYQIKDIKEELKTRDIKRILLQLKKLRCFEVNFSGGEPFLRDDFFEILIFATGLGFRVRVLTNGTLLDRDCVKKLSKINIAFVKLSLYGLKEETHDFTTRVKGSFNRTLKAVGLLEEFGIKFRIAFLVMKHNFFEAQIFKRIAKKKKWDVVFDHVIMPTADRKLFPLRYRITDEQASLALEDADTRKQFIREKSVKPAGRWVAGKFLAYIAPDGEVYSNCALRIPCGNLKFSSFSDIWHNSEALNRLRKLTVKDFECSACKFFSRCMSVPPLFLLEEEALTESPKELCRFTKLAIAKEKEYEKRRFGHEEGK